MVLANAWRAPELAFTAAVHPRDAVMTAAGKRGAPAAIFPQNCAKLVSTYSHMYSVFMMLRKKVSTCGMGGLVGQGWRPQRYWCVCA